MVQKQKKETTKKSDQYSTNAVVRTLSLLEVLVDNSGAHLEELTEQAGIPRATVFRFLQTLQNEDYVSKDDDGRYFLTTKLFTLGTRSLGQVELSRLAKPFMEKLTFEQAETCILGILDANTVVYLDRVESKYSTNYFERIGKKVPLYCTSMGKVILANLSKEAQMDYLNTTPLIAYTKHTITDRSVLEQQLEQVRITGIAYSLEEYEEDQISISVPIYSFEKSVIAALCICWPNFRHTEEKKERATKHLIAIAQDISTAMGYHGA